MEEAKTEIQPPPPPSSPLHPGNLRPQSWLETYSAGKLWKERLTKKRHSNMISPLFLRIFSHCVLTLQNRWFQQALFFFFFFKSNTCTPHTNISACIQFVHTHTSTSMSSCTLQPFPPCVRFTRHFCCLPWVFRVMLCVESSQPNSPAWSQMAWCGWLWLCLLSSPDRHMMNHIPAPSKTAHRGRYTGSLTNTARSGARREKQLSSTRFLHGD